MTTNAYTLEFPRELSAVSSKNHPASCLLSAIIYALTVSFITQPFALLLSSMLPAFFVITKRFSPSRLYVVNIANVIMILTLALTWPDFSGGLRMGVIIALRVNMICAVFTAMVIPLGTSGMYEALCVIRVPEKLRVLIILTLRGIYTLRERYESAIIAVRLRAPKLRGLMRLKIFAHIMGMILLQSSLRSENIMRAVKCRGGFGGFMQAGNFSLNLRDCLFIAGNVIYSVMIVLMNYA